MHTGTLSPGRNFSVGFGLFQGSSGQRIALPFRRSIKVILVVAAVAIVMTIPAVSVFADTAREWGTLESLFDLTSALFMSGWLLGWSAGLFIVYSALALVALGANLVPLVGVLLLGWDLGELMVLFWAESGIIGFYNLCKMAVVQGWLVLFTGLFFIGHFGAFMSMHFLFIYEIFVKNAGGADSSLAEVGRFFYPLWPALLALLLSHGLSFFVNFIGGQEYRNKSAKEQMQEPYGRVVIMHLTVIFGGGMAMVLGSPVPALLLLVVLKILADIRTHQRQRQA